MTSPGSRLTAVLSYGSWQRAFGGDPKAIGREILLNGARCTHRRRHAQGIQFPPGETDPPEIWSPTQIDPASPGGRGGHFLSVIARLKPGVNMRQARDEMTQLVQQWGLAEAPMVHVFSPKNHPV